MSVDVEQQETLRLALWNKIFAHAETINEKGLAVALRLERWSGFWNPPRGATWADVVAAAREAAVILPDEAAFLLTVRPVARTT